MPAPRGVYPIPLELEDGEQEALLWTDDAGTPANVLRVNLVDDEIVIGSSGRPLSLKVYDATLGTAVAPAMPKTIARLPEVSGEVGRWDFDGDLTDELGSYDLTAAGTAYYTSNGSDDRTTRLRGLSPASDLWATRSSGLSALTSHYGALTVHLLCVVWPSTAIQNLISLSGSGASETEADNTLLNAYLTARELVVGWEYSTGTNAGAIFEAPPLGRPTLISVVRDASGNASAYADGVALTSKTVIGAAAPTGGSSAILRLGIATDGSSFPFAHGTWIGGLQWIHAEMTASAIQAHAAAVGVR